MLGHLALVASLFIVPTQCSCVLTQALLNTSSTVVLPSSTLCILNETIQLSNRLTLAGDKTTITCLNGAFLNLTSTCYSSNLLLLCFYLTKRHIELNQHQIVVNAIGEVDAQIAINPNTQVEDTQINSLNAENAELPSYSPVVSTLSLANVEEGDMMEIAPTSSTEVRS